MQLNVLPLLLPPVPQSSPCVQNLQKQPTWLVDVEKFLSPPWQNSSSEIPCEPTGDILVRWLCFRIWAWLDPQEFTSKATATSLACIPPGRSILRRNRALESTTVPASTGCPPVRAWHPPTCPGAWRREPPPSPETGLGGSGRWELTWLIAFSGGPGVSPLGRTVLNPSACVRQVQTSVPRGAGGSWVWSPATTLCLVCLPKFQEKHVRVGAVQTHGRAALREK